MDRKVENKANAGRGRLRKGRLNVVEEPTHLSLSHSQYNVGTGKLSS